MPDLEISQPERSDAGAILVLASEPGLFSELEVATVRELLDASFDQGPERSGYCFLLARDPCGLAGFACYGPRALTSGTFDLFWIVVAPRVARCGIGGRLLEGVEERVRALGGRLLLAETSGTQAYLPARQFYAGHGFVHAVTIPDFYSPGDDLVFYIRRLNETVGS